MATNTHPESSENTNWHTLGYEDCLDRLKSEHEGLRQDQADER